jgi:hypothetical protein
MELLRRAVRAWATYCLSTFKAHEQAIRHGAEDAA